MVEEYETGRGGSGSLGGIGSSGGIGGVRPLGVKARQARRLGGLGQLAGFRGAGQFLQQRHGALVIDVAPDLQRLEGAAAIEHLAEVRGALKEEHLGPIVERRQTREGHQLLAAADPLRQLLRPSLLQERFDEGGPPRLIQLAEGGLFGIAQQQEGAILIKGPLGFGPEEGVVVDVAGHRRYPERQKEQCGKGEEDRSCERSHSRISNARPVPARIPPSRPAVRYAHRT